MPVTIARPSAAPARLARPLKTHGGKSYLARRIVALMPPHVHFVEPYFGGGAVLLAKSPDGMSEVANDLDGNLTNFWRVLQDGETFSRFARIVEATPFSEIEWNRAGDRLDGADPVSRAVAFFVRCRQSLAGRMDSFAPLSRTRTRRQMNEQTSAWIGAVDGLEAVHARLKRVAILNRPALEVIKSQDGARTLFYCDPPYLPSTRTAPKVYGEFEMSHADHWRLLTALCQCQGKVMVSGYANPLYDRMLAGWTRHDFDMPNHAANGKEQAADGRIALVQFFTGAQWSDPVLKKERRHEVEKIARRSGTNRAEKCCAFAVG